MGILWTIIIGFIAGVIAKFLMPGPNEPSGFVLTAILGIVGAFVATFLGQAVGWYRAGEGAGLIGAVVGAVIVLAIWGAIASRRSSALYLDVRGPACGTLKGGPALVSCRAWVAPARLKERAPLGWLGGALSMTERTSCAQTSLLRCWHSSEQAFAPPSAHADGLVSQFEFAVSRI